MPTCFVDIVRFRFYLFSYILNVSLTPWALIWLLHFPRCSVLRAIHVKLYSHVYWFTTNLRIRRAKNIQKSLQLGQYDTSQPWLLLYILFVLCYFCLWGSHPSNSGSTWEVTSIIGCWMAGATIKQVYGTKEVPRQLWVVT